jgi:hypothetical protein
VPTLPGVVQPPAPVVQPKEQAPPAAAAEPPDLAQMTQIPPRVKIFQIYDDAHLEKAILARVREDLLRRPGGGKGDPGRFPPLDPVVPPGTPFVAKTVDYPPAFAMMEPKFVIHRRLHFEEKNSERYGWDLGFIQPFVSAANFYKDMILWPNSLVTGAVVGFWDTSAGKCLPGAAVPYYLYPQGLTITGTAAEAAVITGVAFIIP